MRENAPNRARGMIEKIDSSVSKSLVKSAIRPEHTSDVTIVAVVVTTGIVAASSSPPAVIGKLKGIRG